jgi:hypothetical protein
MLSHCTPRAKGRPPISGMRLSLQNKVFLRVRQVCRIQCGGICFSVSVGRKTCDAEKIFLVLLIIDATILSHATNETAGRVVSYTGLRICGAPDEALNPADLQQVLADMRFRSGAKKFFRQTDFALDGILFCLSTVTFRVTYGSTSRRFQCPCTGHA